MFEYIFRLYRTKMIDEEQWLRWEATVKSMITIKVQKGMDNTKVAVHTSLSN
jgi:hypothetical protein